MEGTSPMHAYAPGSIVKPWYNPTTLALINAYKEQESVFKNPKTKSQGWMMVSGSLLTLNINKDPKSCRTKWHNLAKSYGVIKDNKKDTARKRIKLAFFEEMDDVLGAKKVIVFIKEATIFAGMAVIWRILRIVSLYAECLSAISHLHKPQTK